MKKSKSIQAFALWAAPFVMACTFVASPLAIAADGEKSSTDPALRGAIGKVGSSPDPAATVESFFQVGPVNNSRARQVARVPAALPPGPADKKPVLKEVGHALWHVMDNAGVPMFLGKSNDLDPSIDTSHGMPPSMVPTLKRTDKAVENAKQTVVEGPSQIDTGAIHKIPQSELEGVELPTLHDAQTQSH
jgi:hypothetical protein